jgi:hypothetical protein
MQAASTFSWKTRAIRGIRWIWRIGLVAFFGWVAISVAWISIRSDDFPAALLEPDPDSLDLGTLWPQSDLVVPLLIHNRGSRSLVVRDFETSFPVRRAGPLPRTIPPGQSYEFQLHVDLMGLLASSRHADSNSWIEPFALLIRPITNWGRAPLPWRLRGVARLPVRGLPSTVSFGPWLTQGVVPDPQDLELEVHEAIQQLDFLSDSPLVRAELHPREENSLSSGRTFNLRVIPEPGLTERPGPFQSRLRISAVTTDGTRLDGPDLFVAGGVVRDLQLVPSQMLVTYGDIGESHQRWLSLNSRTGREFDVLGWEISGDEVDLVVDAVSPPDGPPPSELAHSQSFQLSLHVRVPPSSVSQIRIQVRYRDADKLEEFELPVRWFHGATGIAP